MSISKNFQQNTICRGEQILNSYKGDYSFLKFLSSEV
ncbi:hypothetical protein GFO_2566 [Christiangramia forsetii KT0803]|uniref:Uncharacterized protein n=1 Tax=Christiangramia forsetii (strain DSM 17595 / CGMCC 1.15422 / KT0803) TaxID=411154 RepID=A0M4H6_CHRFK|nr:hypothetical protein GFO_2566 [Christiangramia forsetii KT0803]